MVRYLIFIINILVIHGADVTCTISFITASILACLSFQLDKFIQSKSDPFLYCHMLVFTFIICLRTSGFDYQSDDRVILQIITPSPARSVSNSTTTTSDDPQRELLSKEKDLSPLLIELLDSPPLKIELLNLSPFQIDPIAGENPLLSNAALYFTLYES